jgi:N-acyl-D-aspartate/D-glutamate deacylase
MRFLLSITLVALTAAFGQTYDLVISQARSIDPESKMDAVRNVGINGGRIAGISDRTLNGKRVVDGKGLVLAPGFIDLHWHGQKLENYSFKAMDGVTSALELEIGVADVDRWYGERAGKALIHHGVAVGHVPVRMELMGDGGSFLPADKAAYQPATEEQITLMKARIEKGLKRGAVGVGFGVAYTRAATYWEILEMFRVAARFQAPVYTHVRGGNADHRAAANREIGVSEAIANAAITGAPVHIVHVNSMGLESVGHLLQMVADARKRGLDITTEAYPYAASQTRIESALFDGWDDRPADDYPMLQWARTGERLTREKFLQYRKEGGSVVFHHNKEERVIEAITNPLSMIASDGADFVGGGGHPRAAGTFCRVLGRYVREQKALPLIDAIEKMTLMPAKRLEGRVPGMRNKGRIKVGADADLVLFDPATVSDRATFEKPVQYSQGMQVVLVGGVPVVDGGKLVSGAAPGKALRGTVLE